MLKNDFLNELFRKGIHLSSVIFPLSFIFFDNEFPFYLIYLSTLLLLIIDFVRLFSSTGRKYIYKFFHRVIREKEQNNLMGSSTMMIAESFLITFFADKTLIVAAMLFLIFGDTFAAIIGKKYGRIIFFSDSDTDKSLSGSITFLIVCVIISIIFGGYNYLFVGAFASAFIEFFPTNIDDNFSVPIFSIICMGMAKILL